MGCVYLCAYVRASAFACMFASMHFSTVYVLLFASFTALIRRVLSSFPFFFLIFDSPPRFHLLQLLFLLNSPDSHSYYRVLTSLLFLLFLILLPFLFHLFLFLLLLHLFLLSLSPIPAPDFHIPVIPPVRFLSATDASPRRLGLDAVRRFRPPRLPLSPGGGGGVESGGASGGRGRGGGRQARGKGERLCLLGGQEEEGTESQLERRRNFEVRWSHGEWEMVNDMICTIPDERAI